MKLAVRIVQRGESIPFCTHNADLVTRAMEDATSIEYWVRIVRGGFLEIPGLQLTRPQIQKLWNLDEPVCGEVLDTLLREAFLQVTTEGRYVARNHSRR